MRSDDRRVVPAPIQPHLRRSGRPAPTGRNVRGIDLYSSAAVKAYRMRAGVSQEQVAERLRISQSEVAGRENLDRRGAEFHAKQALPLMDAVDAVLRDRERMIAEGEASWASLADGTYVIEATGGRFRTAAEADKILAARGREGER